MTADNPNFINRQQLVEEIAKRFDGVNAEKVVLDVVHLGDKSTWELVRNMDINDRALRVQTISAIFEVRKLLDLHVE